MCVTLAHTIGNLELATDTTVVRADKEHGRGQLTGENWFRKLVPPPKKDSLHSVSIKEIRSCRSKPCRCTDETLQLPKATPMEEAQIRLSLLELRRSKGVTMAGVDKWCLYNVLPCCREHKHCPHYQHPACTRSHHVRIILEHLPQKHHRRCKRASDDVLSHARRTGSQVMPGTYHVCSCMSL
jgi:hypothetical protein